MPFYLFIFCLTCKCNLFDYANVSTGEHNTKGNLFKLNKSHAKLILRQTHFFIRCKNRNSVSNNTVCVSTCAVFETQLMAYTNFNLRGHAFNVS